MFGLRDKDTQAKILALGKGLPTLDEVLTKTEAEEQAKLAQSKLAKGMKDEDVPGVNGIRHVEEDKDDEKGNICQVLRK